LPSKAKLKSNKTVVAGIVEELKAAKGIVLVDYRGINVEQDTQLRTELRKAGVKYTVVKNTMLAFAAKEAGYDGLVPALVGPTAMATSSSDVIAPAKILAAYAKKNDKVTIKIGVAEGSMLDTPGVSALANMPPKEALIASALGALKSPMYGLVTVLSGNMSGLVRVLDSIAKQKEAA
jgi:large subunit ribosomal protein L10